MKKNTLIMLLVVIAAFAFCFAGCATYQQDTGCPRSQGIIGTDATWHVRR